MGATVNWYLRRRLQVLLTTLLLLAVIHPSLLGTYGGRTTLGLVFSLTFVAAALAVSEKGRQRVAAFLLGAFGLASHWFCYFIAGSVLVDISVLDCFTSSLFFGLMVGVIVRGILKEDEVSVDSISGAICGYLLLGVIWGSLYAIIESLVPGSFLAREDLMTKLQDAHERRPVLIYFSFVTLTTIGYGDITPIGPHARTLAWLEAMAGQFYVAVFVAGLVGIRISQAAGKKGNE